MIITKKSEEMGKYVYYCPECKEYREQDPFCPRCKPELNGAFYVGGIQAVTAILDAKLRDLVNSPDFDWHDDQSKTVSLITEHQPWNPNKKRER